ncbi:GntR family transcriptional regulator [Methylocapsa sp. S129]|uniref:GntR family transcriptional regulator n=1 Tax=Methylocapsa sp. S129 TaxID=1641869 RepID=UPI00131DE85E|nr:GntR family transcriptional regulator [Methylocapsa sp. S129]
MSGHSTSESQCAFELLQSEAEIPRDVPALAHSLALSKRVRRAILQMLIQGDLRRGATRRIDVLSKVLGVAPTPMRKALAPLAATGPVAHETCKGYWIAPPLTFEQFKEPIGARRLVETAAIGFACRRGKEAFRTGLVAALVTQKAAVDALIHRGRPTGLSGPLLRGLRYHTAKEEFRT